LRLFVGYVVGHNRPVHEVLFGAAKSLASAHDAEFVGMTIEQVAVETLHDVQAKLHRDVPRALTEQHRAFLLSFVRLEPDWSLMPYAHLKDMPAIRWKLQNLEKLKSKNPRSFEEQETLLKQWFDKIGPETAAMRDLTP
jgi:hypothetical protein